MELQIKAKLLEKSAVTTHGETFKKMEIIVELDGKYPQPIKMEVHNDNISKIEHLPIGTSANWHFNLRGRKWTNKETKKVVYFNSLVVWRAEVLETDLTTDIPENTEPLPLKNADIGDIPF